jgi:hypothetical protein
MKLRHLVLILIKNAYKIVVAENWNEVTIEDT